MSWAGDVDSDNVLASLARAIQAVLERTAKADGALREVARVVADDVQREADRRHVEREERRAREDADKRRAAGAEAHVYWSDYRALRGFAEWLQAELYGAEAAVDASNLAALRGTLVAIRDQLAALERARKSEVDEAVKKGAQIHGAL